jgi:hypothetical protein
MFAIYVHRGLPLSSTSKNVHLANFYMADLPYRGCHPWAEFQQFFHGRFQISGYIYYITSLSLACIAFVQVIVTSKYLVVFR